MSSFVWPRAVLLGSSEWGLTPESNHCSPPAQSVQGAWMTNPSVEWLACTFPNTRVQSYYVTPAWRHVWHMLMRQALPVAGSAAISSTAAHHYRNQSHFHLHHLSSSHWWRERVAIILFSHTVRGPRKPFSICISFLPRPREKKPCKIQYCIWHLTHAMNKIRKVMKFF